MATSRRYQGYPYIDPPVTDIPSISADDAARWNNLPRRQLEVNVRREAPSEPIIETQPRAQASYKEDIDAPVLYIDLPDENGSDIATSLEPTPDEPAFVQETIFYDPFENRRIDRAKESDEESDVSSSQQRLPQRPRALDLDGAGPSGVSSQPSIPSLMSKEAEIYGRRDGDFPASPIPISQFPEPPPAYAEIDARQTEARSASPPQTLVILPGDNTPTTPTALPNTDRKYLNCHHCNMRVRTLVIRETGKVTHATAATCCLIGCFPAIILIYWTDYLKVKNHYCPNCNNIIGYQQPLSGNKIVVSL